jgi:hypothetical protein
MESPECDA